MHYTRLRPAVHSPSALVLHLLLLMLKLLLLLIEDHRAVHASPASAGLFCKDGRVGGCHGRVLCSSAGPWHCLHAVRLLKALLLLLLLLLTRLPGDHVVDHSADESLVSRQVAQHARRRCLCGDDRLSIGRHLRGHHHRRHHGRALHLPGGGGQRGGLICLVELVLLVEKVIADRRVEELRSGADMLRLLGNVKRYYDY